MTQQAGEMFRLKEATIDDLHQAIRDGGTTGVAIVQHYIDRVRAYNGVSSALVIEDGEPVAEAASRFISTPGGRRQSPIAGTISGKRRDRNRPG